MPTVYKDDGRSFGPCGPELRGYFPKGAAPARRAGAMSPEVTTRIAMRRGIVHMD